MQTSRLQLMQLGALAQPAVPHTPPTAAMAALTNSIATLLQSVAIRTQARQPEGAAALRALLPPAVDSHCSMPLQSLSSIGYDHER